MDGSIYTAVLFEEKPQKIGIFETKLEIINGVSSAPTTTWDSAKHELGPFSRGRVIDIKFLDDKLLLLLCQTDGNPPYLTCTPFRQEDAEKDLAVIQNLIFPEDLTAFAPVLMEVLGSNETRGGVPARVSLLGQDRSSCKVFALRGKELAAV